MTNNSSEILGALQQDSEPRCPNCRLPLIDCICPKASGGDEDDLDDDMADEASMDDVATMPDMHEEASKNQSSIALDQAKEMSPFSTTPKVAVNAGQVEDDDSEEDEESEENSDRSPTAFEKATSIDPFQTPTPD